MRDPLGYVKNTNSSNEENIRSIEEKISDLVQIKILDRMNRIDGKLKTERILDYV